MFVSAKQGTCVDRGTAHLTVPRSLVKPEVSCLRPVTVVAALLVLMVARANGADIEARFWTEAPSGWKRIVDGLSNVSVEYRLVHADQQPNVVQECSLCLREFDHLMLHRVSIRDKGTSATVENPDYAFDVNGSKHTGAKWLIEAVVRSDAVRVTLPETQKRLEIYRSRLLFSVRAERYLLPDLVQNLTREDWQVERVEGTSYVRFASKSPVRIGQGPEHAIWVTLDTDQNWRAVSSGAIDREYETKVDLDYRSDDPLLPAVVNERIIARVNNIALVHKRYEFRPRKECELNPAEFRLAAFGLPEPPPAGAIIRRKWTIIVLGNITLIGVILAFWLIRRRARS